MDLNRFKNLTSSWEWSVLTGGLKKKSSSCLWRRFEDLRLTWLTLMKDSTWLWLGIHNLRLDLDLTQMTRKSWLFFLSFFFCAYWALSHCMTRCMQAWVILAASSVKACVFFRYRVFSPHKANSFNVGAHNPTPHRTRTHLVRRTCFFVHVCDGRASLSGVVSVSLLLFLTELCPVWKQKDPSV